MSLSAFGFVDGLCSFYDNDLEKALNKFRDFRFPKSERWYKLTNEMLDAQAGTERHRRRSMTQALAFAKKGLEVGQGNTKYMIKMYLVRAETIIKPG